MIYKKKGGRQGVRHLGEVAFEQFINFLWKGGYYA